MGPEFHAPVALRMCFSPIQALWISIISSEALQSPQLSPSSKAATTGAQNVCAGYGVYSVPGHICVPWHLHLSVTPDRPIPGYTFPCVPGTGYWVHNGVYPLI